MANNKTDYLESALINAVLRNVSFTSPSAVYLALFTTLPADDGTGGVEVSGGSYARQAISFSAPSQVSNAATCSNSAQIQFTTATANWGTITGIGICDASTAGNILYYGSVAVAKTVASGDQVTFPAASVVVSES